ncbi:MAG: hypothetical protein AAF447_09980 [Myxococcota bacterium]
MALGSVLAPLALACDFSSGGAPPSRPVAPGAGAAAVRAEPAKSERPGARFRRLEPVTTPGRPAQPYTYTERLGEPAQEEPAPEGPDTEAMLRAALGNPSSCGSLGEARDLSLGLFAYVTANGVVSRSQVSGSIPEETRRCLEARIANHRFGPVPAGAMRASVDVRGTAGEATDVEVPPPPPNSGSGAIVGIGNAGRVQAPPAPSGVDISNAGALRAPPTPSGVDISNAGAVRAPPAPSGVEIGR